ncbi:MAG TPA: glycosyltransferase family 4 protein [Thermoanaerobaculia bacterium]|nr:glycosyltransferase family 4 protein [Thermoanaerobaculia bacterium]
MAIYEPSGHGGICHYTYQLADALSRRGCDVTVVTPESWELARLPRTFRVRFVARRSILRRLLRALHARRAGRPTEGSKASPARWSSRLASWLSGPRRRLRLALITAGIVMRRFDVVHVHSIGLGTERRLVRLFRVLGLPVLCTAHEAVPHEQPSAEQLRELGELYGSVTRIVVHAGRTRDELVRLFAVDRRKIVVIPHGAYDLFFPNGRISREDARARVGFPARPTILFFGLIRRYKGLEYLMEAFARVQETLPDAMLAIVGELFRGDDAGYADYSRLIADLARRTNVRRIAGYVPLESVGAYLSAADVVVLPYTQTSQSGVLLAAFAAGRPAVVTDTGGLSETVADGFTGFVVPPRDADALAGAILRVLRDPDAAEAMGRNSAREADTTYSWDRIAARTADLYASAISERRAFQ